MVGLYTLRKFMLFMVMKNFEHIAIQVSLRYIYFNINFIVFVEVFLSAYCITSFCMLRV